MFGKTLTVFYKHPHCGIVVVNQYALHDINASLGHEEWFTEVNLITVREYEIISDSILVR